MTNGDKIRQMSDEELAKEIASGDCYCCIVEEQEGFYNCYPCALKWLKEEAKE